MSLYPQSDLQTKSDTEAIAKDQVYPCPECGQLGMVWVKK